MSFLVWKIRCLLISGTTVKVNFGFPLYFPGASLKKEASCHF